MVYSGGEKTNHLFEILYLLIIYSLYSLIVIIVIYSLCCLKAKMTNLLRDDY